MSETVVQMLRSGQEDLEWFNSNLERFKDKYDNQFLAILNKRVIDSDKNVDSLMNKLRKKHINTSDVLVRFVSKVKSIL